MDENREISSAPSSIDEGRSAKASGRTADVHVLEKSDCAVVPVNQPNKAAIAAAEANIGYAFYLLFTGSKEDALRMSDLWDKSCVDERLLTARALFFYLAGRRPAGLEAFRAPSVLAGT